MSRPSVTTAKTDAWAVEQIQRYLENKTSNGTDDEFTRGTVGDIHSGDVFLKTAGIERYSPESGLSTGSSSPGCSWIRASSNCRNSKRPTPAGFQIRVPGSRAGPALRVF